MLVFRGDLIHVGSEMNRKSTLRGKWPEGPEPSEVNLRMHTYIRVKSDAILDKTLKYQMGSLPSGAQ